MRFPFIGRLDRAHPPHPAPAKARLTPRQACTSLSPQWGKRFGEGGVLGVAAFLFLLLLAACTTEHSRESGYLTAERRAEIARRPIYQRLFQPIYPSDETPRLTVLGDLDTPRNYEGKAWRHQGLDIVGRSGDVVIAVAPGEACVTRDEINGLTVTLRPRLSPGAGAGDALSFVLRGKSGDVARYPVRIAYAHLLATTVSGCRFVEMGEPLGTIGASGIASDPHLHFEIVAEPPDALPGEPKLGGAINPFVVMRRAAEAPIGTITCYAPGMTHRPNAGDPEGALTIVWPTLAC